MTVLLLPVPTKRCIQSIQRNVALVKVEMEVNMDTSPNMAEVTAMEDIKSNTMVIVTEDSMAEVIKAMEATNMEGDTKLKDTNPNMEVVST